MYGRRRGLLQPFYTSSGNTDTTQVTETTQSVLYIYFSFNSGLFVKDVEWEADSPRYEWLITYYVRSRGGTNDVSAPSAPFPGTSALPSPEEC